MNVTDITSPDWQISAAGFGQIVQGVDSVNQSLTILLSTQLGSNPLRQAFGIDLMARIDQPITEMAPVLVKDMIDQVALYVPRITLSGINYSTQNDGRVLFGLTWSYVAGYAPFGYSTVGGSTANSTYFLLTNESGFILLSDFDVALILN